MSLWKRTVLYIRRKRKCLVLFGVFLVLSLLGMLGISVYQAGGAYVAELSGQMGAYFYLYPTVSSAEVDADLTEQIRENGNIKEVNGMNVCYLYTPGLELAPGRFAGTGSEEEHMPRYLSNTHSGLYDYFLNGVVEMAEGERIRAADHGKALVSCDLAERNGLQIGDTISAVMTEQGATVGRSVLKSDKNGEKFVFQIKGIYRIKEKPVQQGGLAECNLLENYIFIDERSGSQILGCLEKVQSGDYREGAMCFVKDPESLEETIQQIQQSVPIDWSKISISDNREILKDTLEPLLDLKSSVLLFLAIIVLVGTVILILILTMWIRGRVHEAGVLLAIGIRKKEIFLQYYLECMILFVVACIAAGVFAFVFMKTVGESLFKDFAVIGLDLTLTHGVIVFLVGAAVILISVGAASGSMLRLKPREILSDTNN